MINLRIMLNIFWEKELRTIKFLLSLNIALWKFDGTAIFYFCSKCSIKWQDRLCDDWEAFPNDIKNIHIKLFILCEITERVVTPFRIKTCWMIDWTKIDPSLESCNIFFRYCWVPIWLNQNNNREISQNQTYI